MQLLKQSTAATVLVGPVLDSAGLAITTAVIGDFQLTKNGSTAALASPATATHSHNGNYLIALSTGNTDTAGQLVITVNNAAQAMGTHRYTVLIASVFDAIVTNATNATGGLPTATGTISALSGAVSTLTAGGVRTELAAELARIDATIGSRATPTNITQASGVTLAAVTHTGAVIPTVTDVTTKTGYTATVSDKTGFSLTPTTGLGNQTANITGNLSGTVGSVTGAVGSVTSYGTLVSDIATAVWSAGTRTLTSFGTLVSDVATAVWGAASRTLTAFGFSVNLTPSTGMGNQNGTVGGISGVTFPANFGSFGITVGGGIAELGPNALAANDLYTPIANAVAATQALNRLNSMIESDGAGQFRFDTIAVSMVTGGAGATDWTANERTAIRTIFGIPTSGTTPTDPTSGILDEIRDKTALITAGGTVNVTTPVTATGQLTSPLIIGDDYLAANGRRFRWTVALPSGYVIATSTARFGMRYEDDEGLNTFVATGTVTDATGGNVYLDFDVAKTVTGTLRPGWYQWSVEIVSGLGVEITRVKSGKNAEWQEKQT